MKKTFKIYTLLFASLMLLSSFSSVWAIWHYSNSLISSITDPLQLHLNEFVYLPEMPEDEVTLLQRIRALLNNNYSNDTIPEGEGRNYLLSTLDKDWTTGLNPSVGSFVGSMDPTTESRVRFNAMFGDILDFNASSHVSFILKSEDLVGGVNHEIALYTTSDPLDWSTSHWTTSVVGVYLSVFVPILDEQGAIVAYELICDSIHGYCMEVQYMEGSNIASFSTDHWRDELFYWHEDYAELQPIIGEDRYKYECYHPADGCYAYPNRTISWMGWIEVETDQWNVSETAKGKKASQKLEEILASQ